MLRRPMPKLIRSLAVLSCVYIPPSYSQVTVPAAADEKAWAIPSSDAIRALLAQRMQHNGVGIVVGVIEPGGRRVISYGKMADKDERPLDGTTVFQIGSVTKVFTGLLLADMVQRGEVGIDDTVAKYLPSGVTMPRRGRPITLIDLSKHWSGLPSMPTNFPLDGEPDPYAAYTPDQLFAFLSTYALPREPGKQQYSNLGVALLGRVLARRANTDYEQLLKERVLIPLELNDTAITLSADQARRLAPGHDRFLAPGGTWEMRAMPASGSLRSTVNDLLSFLAYNLGEEESPLYAAMVYQRTPMRVLGWGRSTLGGDDVYGHDGGKEGYRSAIVFNPRTKTGVVVLANARTDDRPILLARHLLFAGSPLPPAAHAPIRPKIVKVPTAILDAYAGEYRVDSSQLLRIARRRDHLLLDISGDGVLALWPASEREFFSNTEDMRVEFQRDQAGGVTGLALHESNEKQSAIRIRQRTASQ